MQTPLSNAKTWVEQTVPQIFKNIQYKIHSAPSFDGAQILKEIAEIEKTSLEF